MNIYPGANDPEMLRVIRLYALPDRRLFRPMRCKPTDTELIDHPTGDAELKGNTGKVCFAGKREAQGFADAMAGLNRDLVEPYWCERGHWHVRNINKSIRLHPDLRKSAE